MASRLCNRSGGQFAAAHVSGTQFHPLGPFKAASALQAFPVLSPLRPCRLQRTRCTGVAALRSGPQQQQRKLHLQQQQPECLLQQPVSAPQQRHRSSLPHSNTRNASAARQQTICRAAASSPAFPSNGGSGSSEKGMFSGVATLTQGLSETAEDLKDLLKRFLGLWRQFLPMLSLFFCLSFINTMLDSLKDTLVITAAGGGAFVIPYLTVYAVLPLSMVFLVAFSFASQRMSRSALFNSIIMVFVAFFAVFALFLYPNADVLHPHEFADKLQNVLPMGLAGAVGMWRNWTFTLFFCMSELWGDVCMGLLFWGLANEITNLSDAATLYPLFGLGANLAQAIAGLVLKATTRGGATEFATALQASMAAVVTIACIAIMLQQHITNKAAEAAAALKHRHAHRHNSTTSSSTASGADFSRAATPLPANPTISTTSIPAAAAGSLVQSAAQQADTAQLESAQLSTAQESTQEGGKKKKRQASLAESFRILAASVELRCLATMSLAQGLCNSLMEFAWKCHMRILYPSPADFTAFLGDVATWSGVVTGGLMLLSPLLFERMGWHGVAISTPRILLFGGSAFFATCIAYQHLFGHAVAAGGAAAAGPAGVALLQGLVIFGALLYVFGRGAKFSLFKPAEEMVYITLDEDGRTRGKAAIDVVGAQTGKSCGSLLQQALLITSAGSIVGIMPVLFAVFFAMLRGWTGAVSTLSNVRHYSYDSPISSLDEEDPGNAAAAAVAAGGSSGSSGGLQAAEQQELLLKLQGLAEGSSSTEQQQGAFAAAAEAQHGVGSKSFQAAVARSSSSSSKNGSSGGDSGTNGSSEVNADTTSSSSSHEGHLDRTSSSSSAAAGSQQFVALSHDAASAFRRSRREAAHGSGAIDSPHSSSNGTGSGSSADGGAHGISGSSSKVTQGGDAGSV